MKRKRSFTLVELLIVTGIFSLLIVSIYSAFRTGLASQRKIDAATDLYQKARLSLSLMETELRNVFVYSKSDSRFIGNSEAMEFFSILDKYDKEGQVSSGIGYIKYEILGNSLTRKAGQGMFALKAASEGENKLFLSEVEELSMQFAAPSTDLVKSYEWQDLWPQHGDVNQKKQLPVAVKIKLVLKQKDNNSVEFNKIIPIYSR